MIIKDSVSFACCWWKVVLYVFSVSLTCSYMLSRKLISIFVKFHFSILLSRYKLVFCIFAINIVKGEGKGSSNTWYECIGLRSWSRSLCSQPAGDVSRSCSARTLFFAKSSRTSFCERTLHFSRVNLIKQNINIQSQSVELSSNNISTIGATETLGLCVGYLLISWL